MVPLITNLAHTRGLLRPPLLTLKAGAASLRDNQKAHEDQADRALERVIAALAGMRNYRPGRASCYVLPTIGGI